MIDSSRYAFLRASINTKVKDSTTQMVKGIEKSITEKSVIAQDIAAGIFGVIGVYQLLLLGINLNGGVIGIMMVEEAGITFLHALVPLTISTVLFWKNKRKEKKKGMKKKKL